MTDAFRLLTDDEVRQIVLIIESLDRSTFDFLKLEFGDVKLTIGKGPPPAAVAAVGESAVAPAISAPQQAGTVSQLPSIVPPAVTVDKADEAGKGGKGGKGGKNKVGQADGVDVVAPLLGRFYAQSEPGAPPFVSVGSQVTEDTTVGLIEVMKTFNAVCAGVSGVVTEICVQDAQLVEYGEVLFRVRPHKAA
ncbi:MAG: biotin/lipoyl-containing protein [Xanthobacteraceae bacterium]